MVHFRDKTTEWLSGEYEPSTRHCLTATRPPVNKRQHKQHHCVSTHTHRHTVQSVKTSVSHFVLHCQQRSVEAGLLNTRSTTTILWRHQWPQVRHAGETFQVRQSRQTCRWDTYSGERKSITVIHSQRAVNNINYQLVFKWSPLPVKPKDTCNTYVAGQTCLQSPKEPQQRKS